MEPAFFKQKVTGRYFVTQQRHSAPNRSSVGSNPTLGKTNPLGCSLVSLQLLEMLVGFPQPRRMRCGMAAAAARTQLPWIQVLG